jgi:hypothetical protein
MSLRWVVGAEDVRVTLCNGGGELQAPARALLLLLLLLANISASCSSAALPIAAAKDAMSTAWV